jgi:hypothetical protein
MVPGLVVLPWDGFHDLSERAELHGMVGAFLRNGEKLAVVQKLNGEWQCGWKHRLGRFEDVWGMPMATAPEALEDATRRFFKGIKGLDIHRHHPPVAMLGKVTWHGVIDTIQQLEREADKQS